MSAQVQLDVPRLEWPAFMRRFRWEQGQHVILLGPTGRGKSVLASHILQRRDYVVVLDVKGDDPSLVGAGYRRIDSWPQPKLEREAERTDSDLRLRLSPPPTGTLRERIAAARDTFLACLEDVSVRGGWTIYIDELRITGEPRLYDLAPEIDALVLGGRSKGVSIVSATQAPRWVPKAAYDQVQHVFVWPVRDQHGLRRMEEIAGVGRELRSTLERMQKHDVLYRRPPDVSIVTRAPGPQTRAEPVDTPEPDEQPSGDRRPKGSPSKYRKHVWGTS